jgi:hypothetical protein
MSLLVSEVPRAAIAADWKCLPRGANVVDPLDKCPGGAEDAPGPATEV